MYHAPPQTAVLAVCFLLFIFPAASNAHNITRILAKHPQFSTFNHYLTITHLAAEINRRLTITVLAVDNAGMSSLLSKHLSISTIKNVLSLHVLVDYFGSKKLHQINGGTALSSTMFQASGAATGTSGFVNITNLKGGKVAFGAEDNDGKLDSVYVKSLEEIPYNISVLQISKILTSSEAEAPTAEPSQLNLTSILSEKGCKAFSDLLVATGADTTFQSNVDGGLTVFCPTDTVMNGFMPKYNNLTAAKKLSLLLYHGVPVYQSLQMLKSNNGLINTLATDGKNKYDFTVQNDGEVVTLETKVITATITGTVKDEDPLVVYKIDKVLQPTELYKAAPVTKEKKAPAPKAKADETEADAPAEEAEAPADDSEDLAADENGAGRLGKVMVVLGLCLGVAFM